MAELNSRAAERLGSGLAGGLKLMARGDRFEIWSDEVKHIATIQVKAGPWCSKCQLVIVEVQSPKTKMGWKLLEYAASSLQDQTASMPFLLKSASAMKVAEHLYRAGSRSLEALRKYARTLQAFCSYVGKGPDELIATGLSEEGAADPVGIHKLTQLVDEYLGELEASDLASGTIAVRQAHIKTFFRVNGIALEPMRRYSLRVKYRDRAPKLEEVQRIIEVADLREKAMVMLLATGGFRIGTLLKLRYGHVREGLEDGRVPVHIHVEAEITKGKYADYDTFINEEASHYLKLYLEERKRGTKKIPPEEIADDSPLFVAMRVEANELVSLPDPMDPSRQSVRRRTHRPLDLGSARNGIVIALRRAGLRVKKGRLYELRIHSLRKFFRTQQEALGVPRDYCEYMMGHKLSTYHDIQMKGIDFLRSTYAMANLRVSPKEKASMTDLLKELIRARGEDPAKYLKAEIGSAIDMITPEGESEVYARAVWEMLRKDLVSGLIPGSRAEDKFLSIHPDLSS